MERRKEMDSAEVGTSAMIIFIALILVSSIMSAIILGFGENVFKRSKADAEQNSSSMNGIVVVVVLEIFSLGVNDELHIVFELPYVENTVIEEDLSWVFMCFPPTGEVRVQFDEGDFSLATDLGGDGLTAGALTEFEPGVDYRMIIQLNECDIDVVEDASLILMVDKGRTQERQLEMGSSPYEGQDLL